MDNAAQSTALHAPLAERSALRPGLSELYRGATAAVARGVLRRLRGLQWGSILLTGADRGEWVGNARAGEPQVRIRIHDPEFWWAVATRGSIGAGESFAAGSWSTDDLTGLVRIFGRNFEVLDAVEGGLARFSLPALKLYHRLRQNGRAGACRNIASHYDLGNDFFERMLDPSMMYSSALYRDATATLEQAQAAKLDLIRRRLRLTQSDHLLEIGTGWGGMAIFAAENYGCKVTTTTISEQQYEFSIARVAERGLERSIEVQFRDHRDLDGKFDKLVSIEMIEAIGWRQYPRYLRAISDLLHPDGLALIQAITIRDQRYLRARRSVDFIQRHIFPGSCIPSLGALVQAMSSSSDLRLASVDDLTPHYARILRDWRENVSRHAASLQRAGYDEHFQRLWEFYLCYCEGGFEERAIHDLQLLFAKPLDRASPLLPGVSVGGAVEC